MVLERSFFERMPKVELHTHLDGAVRQEDVHRIGHIQQGREPVFEGVSEPGLEALIRATRLPRETTLRDPADFDRFLRMFNPAISVMQTPGGLHEVARAHVEDLARQGYVYTETRFAPQYHRQRGLSYEDAIANVLRGLEIGYQQTGTRVRLIVCIGREADLKKSCDVTKAALEFQNQGVLALDLACNEAAFPPELHIPAYQLTFGSKLRRTVHAGEFAASEEKRRQNVRTALHELKADGLGHAVPLDAMSATLDRVKERKIRVESCPLSNKITGAVSDIRDIGLDRLLRQGVLVSLNTDDPAIMGFSLADVFKETCDAYGFGLEEVMRFTRNAITSAFCSEEEREWIIDQCASRGMQRSELRF